VTLEVMYPITAPHLAVIRDGSAAFHLRAEAARWLQLNGFDRCEYMSAEDRETVTQLLMDDWSLELLARVTHAGMGMGS